MNAKKTTKTPQKGVPFVVVLKHGTRPLRPFVVVVTPRDCMFSLAPRRLSRRAYPPRAHYTRQFCPRLLRGVSALFAAIATDPFLQ